MNNSKKEGIVFDSSLSLLDNNISLSEYKEKIKFLLEPILIKRFPNDGAKQQIKSHVDRINIACPYCGDSMKNNWAKRGNIILSGKFINTYKCFNCGEFKSIEAFMTDFESAMDLDMANYIEKNRVDFENFINKKHDVSFLLDREAILKYSIPREDLRKGLGLEEIDNYFVNGWLKKRLQFQKERYLYHPTKNYMVILNLVDNDKVIGLQRRNFKGADKYLTYNLSKLYKVFSLPGEIPDDIDSISVIFGIMELNFAQPITLFEGAFDSFLFKNSVALAGAHKSFPVDMPLRYWFDDDKTGREKAVEYIEHNEPVFLWSKFRNEHSIPGRIKWDLNDLMQYLKQKNIKVPSFEPYFSDDPLDIIDI